MYIAIYCKGEIPTVWYHNPEIENKNGETVRDSLR